MPYIEQENLFRTIRAAADVTTGTLDREGVSTHPYALATKEQSVKIDPVLGHLLGQFLVVVGGLARPSISTTSMMALASFWRCTG
jgi:hypothetical protein